MNTLASSVIRIAPDKSLQPFISEYVFRKLTVSEPQPIVKAMPLRVTGSIDFFLGDSFETIDYQSNEIIPFTRCTIRGPRTHKIYQIAIKGRFISFTIKFKPSGLYRLIGIPASLFCNQAIDAQLIKPALFSEITEQLLACKNINECISIVEPYLIQLMLRQHKLRPSAAIDQMTDLISKNKAPANIAGFLEEVCLSARQLERNFIKEVGTSPKLYSNMVRFENMLRHKINFPDKNWTALSYEFNYYDQMHLIKSFQRFLGINPSDFTATNFAL